ncbi:Uncharacterized protein OBRU01_09799 [Operophtera brumata]|uniref:Uncharacterized protein n=1 Tax=Operophtera brumata TaxID=104452 RepID=A0A0L7LCM6_OPEBR|nr:Uncharacterized protein OBRU01_09799 [Operophtera brumata]
MRTLDISDRAIRTVKEKVDENGIIENDLRGKHSNHIRVDETVIADIKKFIEAIPRIESHYTRQTSSREFIDGGKTITELFRDFQEAQQSNNKPTGKYCTFYRVFTEEYNISFFQPRKDQCDFCFQYLNSTAEQKIAMQESYDAHLEEKLLSRQEKHEDRCKIDELTPTKAYTGKQELSENKKKDLRELFAKKLIPSFYADFYNTIL